MPISHINNRDPLGRYGIGRNQNKLVRDYPIWNPSPDIQYLIADMWVVLNSVRFAANRLGTSYKLRWLWGFGDGPAQPSDPIYGYAGTHDKDIELQNNLGSTLLRTSVAPTGNIVLFTERQLSNRLSLVRWQLGGYYDIGIIYHTAWNDDIELAPQEYSRSLFPVSAKLFGGIVTMESTIGLYVKDGTRVVNVTEMQHGFNTTVVKGSSTNPRGDTVKITAGAGLGEGTISACGDNGIVSINGAKPTTDGRFDIKGIACMSVSAPNLVQTSVPITNTTTLVSQHAVHINDDCKKCCDCEDYNEVSTALRQLSLWYSAISQEATTIHTGYASVLAQWKALVACLLYPVKLKLTLQTCPTFNLAMRIYNDSQDAWRDLVLDLYFFFPPVDLAIATVTVFNGDVAVTELKITEYNRRYEVGCLNPGAAVTIKGQYTVTNPSTGVDTNGSPTAFLAELQAYHASGRVQFGGNIAKAEQPVVLPCP
jgi:hypothetical protein